MTSISTTATGFELAAGGGDAGVEGHGEVALAEQAGGRRR